MKNHIMGAVSRPIMWQAIAAGLCEYPGQSVHARWSIVIAVMAISFNWLPLRPRRVNVLSMRFSPYKQKISQGFYHMRRFASSMQKGQVCARPFLLYLSRM
jgi:hypothetical protein